MLTYIIGMNSVRESTLDNESVWGFGLTFFLLATFTSWIGRLEGSGVFLWFKTDDLFGFEECLSPEAAG